MNTCRDAFAKALAGLALGVFAFAPPVFARTALPQGTPEPQRIAAGYDHTCAITDSGDIECWGRNDAGALGDGTFISRGVPTVVRGIGSPAVAIAGGLFHTCAVTTGGAVKCWGLNRNGELGDGTLVRSAIPVDVVGLSSGVIGITAGDNFTCARTTTSEIYCWGRNSSGQLGDGTMNPSEVPVHVLGGGSMADVVAGRYHACVRTNFGGVQCWGENSRGQLGTGSPSLGYNYPQDVVGLEAGVAAITAGGRHSCAVLMSGAVKCWGANEYGQLGDASNSDSATPVQVVSMTSGTAAVRAGAYHTCALQSGSVKCWGFNSTGRLGNGGRSNSSVPVMVLDLPIGVQQIQAGGSQSCAWTEGDAFWCWGKNSYGQIGVGSMGYVRRPAPVSGLESGTSILGVGVEHACAIHSGTVLCWGDNRLGQLGDGTDIEHSTPMPVLGLGADATSLSVAGNHACVLVQDRSAMCWGDNDLGQLGDGSHTNHDTPIAVAALGSALRQIATATTHSCAVTGAGGVKCWGSNAYGALGDNTTDDHLVPADVFGLTSGVAAISINTNHSCALLDSGAVQCWGLIGNSSPDLVPATVPGLDSNVTAIAAGGGADCALISGVELKCWGANDYGQLGNGTHDSSPLNPVLVSGFSSGVTRVSAGESHTCAIDGSGAARCWGLNETGQLGDGVESFEQVLPVDVVGLGSGMTSIAAGSVGTCAISAGGQASCWGENLFGQLGDGSLGSELVPREVLIKEEILRTGFDP